MDCLTAYNILNSKEAVYSNLNGLLVSLRDTAVADTACIYMFRNNKLNPVCILANDKITEVDWRAFTLRDNLQIDREPLIQEILNGRTILIHKDSCNTPVIIPIEFDIKSLIAFPLYNIDNNIVGIIATLAFNKVYCNYTKLSNCRKIAEKIIYNRNKGVKC